MNRYAKAYLDDVANTQGELFGGFAEHFPAGDTASLIESYMKSRTRREIDEGQAYVATMSAGELLERFLAEGVKIVPGAPMQGFAPDWIGRFYAVCQWQTGNSSADVVAAFPVTFMERAYPGLHDLELDLAVAKVVGNYGMEKGRVKGQETWETTR